MPAWALPQRCADTVDADDRCARYLTFSAPRHALVACLSVDLSGYMPRLPLTQVLVLQPNTPFHIHARMARPVGTYSMRTFSSLASPSPAGGTLLGSSRAR